MADSTPLADLLARAGNVFALAGNLGRAFHESHRAQDGVVDAGDWNHAPAFSEFYQAVLDLSEPMQNPPNGFAPVAESLLEAARLAKGIRDAMQRPDGGTWAAHLDCFPALNSVWQNGSRAVKEVTKARQLDDPLAFVDEPGGGDAAKQPFTMLDRFPATTEGHIAFLESVRDEVHYAAEAKRQQFAQKYSNETLASMVRGIKWAESRARIVALPELPADAGEQVARVLQRQLTVGTVEQIDGLLMPAVCALRVALECAELENKTVIVTTVGDLWKALGEGKMPAVEITAISLGPQCGPNIAQPTFPEPADQLKWDTLERALALCDAEGGERGEAMRMLIARVALAMDVDRRQIINMPLSEFVAVANGGDTRLDNGQQAADTPTEATPAGLMPTRRGRRKADYETEQREAQLAADWKRARENGVYKSAFAKEKGMTTAKLDTLLDRVAKRKSRSDN